MQDVLVRELLTGAWASFASTGVPLEGVWEPVSDDTRYPTNQNQYDSYVVTTVVLRWSLGRRTSFQVSSTSLDPALRWLMEKILDLEGWRFGIQLLDDFEQCLSFN